MKYFSNKLLSLNSKTMKVKNQAYSNKTAITL